VTWLSLRLQRLELALAALALSLAAASLVPLGLHMASVYDKTHVGACLTHDGAGCGDVIQSFQQRFEHAGVIIPWLNFLPGVVGVLLAAPLILDFEHGTFRFAWTQSVPRNRWLAGRLIVMCASALLATFALTGLMTWFRGPLDQVNGRMEPNVFDFEGIVPYGYVLFALALAVAIGVVARRAVVAAGVTLIVYFGLRVGLQGWVREDYVAPLRRVWPVGTPGPNHLERAWNITSGPSDAAGHLLSPTAALRVQQLCGGIKRGDIACMRAHHVYNLAVYQPASRFWLLQGIETTIFGGLALVLLAAAAWWIRNRVS